MAFRDRLRQLREAHGISIKRLSEELGVYEQAVFRWEHGHATTLANAIAVADFFKVPLDWLCDRPAYDVILPNREPRPSKRSELDRMRERMA